MTWNKKITLIFTRTVDIHLSSLLQRQKPQLLSSLATNVTFGVTLYSKTLWGYSAWAIYVE